MEKLYIEIKKCGFFWSKWGVFGDIFEYLGLGYSNYYNERISPTFNTRDKAKLWVKENAARFNIANRYLK